MTETDKQKQEVRRFYESEGWQRREDGLFADALKFEDLRPISAEYIHECHLRLNRYLTPRGRFLLDAASGPIQYPEYLSYSDGYDKRVCVDFSVTALIEARATLGDRGIYVLADVSRLPFRDSSMDGVVSLHTIYHLPKPDQIRAFEEVFRVVAPNRKAAVVYMWNKPVLIRILESPLTFKKFAGRIARKLGLRKARAKTAGAQPSQPLFYDPVDPRWFENQDWRFDYEIAVWRSVSVQVLQMYFHGGLFGKGLLRLLFRLEDRFSRWFGRFGQYAVISIRK